MQERSIYLGQGLNRAELQLRFANRHGLIAGATGTGKTVTLQTLAEGFSVHGVPVFVADVKGDLAGISQAGTGAPKLLERAKQVGLTSYAPRAFPTVFWDVFGTQGHGMRTTLSDMGPILLARLLDLPEAQEGALNIAFKVADDEGLLLLDLKDLRALLNYVMERAADYAGRYGRINASSVGAIGRRLLVLENQGASALFGEPAIVLSDLMHTAQDGRGTINILAADRLIQQPQTYAMFLLWLLAELFEELPEIGDVDKPRLAFFFDEAHLLFKDAPKVLLAQIEQVVRLIRSKGVGIYFVTQNPLDIPDAVLGQLGNRIQHALRAFTARDQKALRAAAETFRANPAFDTEQAIDELGVGWALVSTLGEGGVPSVVDKVAIRPPESRLGTITAAERSAVLAASPWVGRYDRLVDRDSAHEQLTARTDRIGDVPSKSDREQKPSGRARDSASANDTPIEAMVKSAARSFGSQLGRQIMRGVLGAFKRRR